MIELKLWTCSVAVKEALLVAMYILHLPKFLVLVTNGHRLLFCISDNITEKIPGEFCARSEVDTKK